MAKTISGMAVLFSATVSPFVKGVNSASTTVTAFTDKVSGAGAAILRMTGVAAGIGAAFGAIKSAADGISIASQLEQTEVAFGTMLRSGDAATAMMQRLTAFATETPFEFPEIGKAAKSLLAFGVSAANIEPTLRKIGDVSSGIGAPLGEIAEIFGKAKVQGTLFAEDINQLVGRGIPVIQEFAKQLGVSEGEVKKLASQGKISFAMLDKAFTDLTSNGGAFTGMMAAQSKTLGGLWSTFTDNVGMSTAGLVKTIVDAFALKGGLSALSNAVGTAGAWLNGTLKTWAPMIVRATTSVWTALSQGFAEAWATVAPYVTKAKTFVTNATNDVTKAIRGASLNASDALSTVGVAVSTGIIAWGAWKVAVIGASAALSVARGTVIAFEGTMIAINTATTAATFVQAGLGIAVAGATTLIAGATIASNALSAAYATARGAVVLLAAANAGLSIGQAFVNTLTIAGGVAQLAYATTLGAVRSAFAGLTVGQALWKAATIAGTAAQWLLNAALTANPIGIVVVGLGALTAWLGYTAVQSGILSTAFGGIQTACDFVSFAFQNFGLVARAGVTGAAYELVKFGNIAVHLFTQEVPAYLGWFASNWRNVFQTSFNFVSAVFTNMGTNIWKFFQAVGSWMSGKGFKFEWTSLTQGFESTMSELPKIAARQAGPLEQQLQKQFDDAAGVMKKGFADFQKGKPVEAGTAFEPPPQAPPPPAAIPAPPPFAFADATVGVNTKPADAALDKTKEKAKETRDAIANIGSGSAEQWQRIARAQFAMGKSADAAPSSFVPTSEGLTRAFGRGKPAMSVATETKPLIGPAAPSSVKPSDYLNRTPGQATGKIVFGGQPLQPSAVPIDRTIQEAVREQPKKAAADKPLAGDLAIVNAINKTTKAIEDNQFEIVEF